MPDRPVSPNWRWPDGQLPASPLFPTPEDKRRIEEFVSPDIAQLRKERDELMAALAAALSLVDDLGSAYHDEGFEGACKGGTGAYATCPNCQQRPGPLRATLARIRGGG